MRHSFVSMTLCVLTMGMAASGCATGATEVRHGLGAGEWQARLPTTASPIHELAYGRGGSSSVDALAGLDNDTPDQVLQPVAMTTAPAAKPAAKRAPLRAATLLTQAPQAPQVATAAEPEAAQAAPAQQAAPELLAQNDASDRYAQREVRSDEQQKFRGGDAIVISAGAIVVVLLVVILILLLR